MIFDSFESQVVDRVTPQQRFAQMRALVETDQQMHIVADCRANFPDRGDVVLRAIASRPQLERLCIRLRRATHVSAPSLLIGFHSETVRAATSIRASHSFIDPRFTLFHRISPPQRRQPHAR